MTSERRLAVQITEEQDGTGEGYGRFAGIRVRDVADKFEKLIEDGSHRAVTAVLRIGREQTLARGDLMANRYAAAFFIMATLATGGALLVVSPATRGKLVMYFGAAACLAALFTLGAIKTYRTSERNRAQEKEIYRLCREALLLITRGPNFKKKPLRDDEQVFLKQLVKKDPSAGALLDLLH